MKREYFRPRLPMILAVSVCTSLLIPSIDSFGFGTYAHQLRSKYRLGLDQYRDAIRPESVSQHCTAVSIAKFCPQIMIHSMMWVPLRKKTFASDRSINALFVTEEIPIPVTRRAPDKEAWPMWHKCIL